MDIPTVLDIKKKGRFVYILCGYCDIYCVVVYDLRYDLTDILVRCSDSSYSESIVKEKLKEID